MLENGSVSTMVSSGSNLPSLHEVYSPVISAQHLLMWPSVLTSTLVVIALVVLLRSRGHGS